MYVKSYYVICVLPTVYNIMYINTYNYVEDSDWGEYECIHFFDVSDFLMWWMLQDFSYVPIRLTSSFTYHTKISC